MTGKPGRATRDPTEKKNRGEGARRARAGSRRDDRPNIPPPIEILREQLEQEHRRHFGRGYPWRLQGRHSDGGPLRELLGYARGLRPAGSPAELADLVAGAWARYLADVGAGRAFPKGKPAGLSHFCRDWAEYAGLEDKDRGLVDRAGLAVLDALLVVLNDAIQGDVGAGIGLDLVDQVVAVDLVDVIGLDAVSAGALRLLLADRGLGLAVAVALGEEQEAAWLQRWRASVARERRSS